MVNKVGGEHRIKLFIFFLFVWQLTLVFPVYAAFPTTVNWGPNSNGMALGKHNTNGKAYFVFDRNVATNLSGKFEVQDTSGNWTTINNWGLTYRTYSIDTAYVVNSSIILDSSKIYRLTFWDASGDVYGGPSYWPSLPLGIPSTPTEVQVTGSGANNGSLSWNANPSSEQVTTYKIYHGSTLLGSTSTTFYNFTDLSVGSHSLYISAVNSIGESLPSESVSYTVLDLPTQVTGLYVIGSGDPGILSWNPNPADEQVTSYKVYDGEVLLGSTSSTSFSFSGSGVGSHTFYVSALNVIGEGSKSQPYLVAVPVTPTGLSTGNISTIDFTLYWISQSDADGYKVYLNGNYVADVSQTLFYNPSYTFTGLTPGQTYTVTVAAFNQWGESTQSQPLSVTLLPSAPTGLQVSNITTNSVDLSWSTVTGATNYAVYFNGSQLATTTDTIYVLTGLNPDTTYSFQVAAINTAGQSELSNSVDATTDALPPAPPAVPTGLSSGNITSTYFTVYWLKQSDAKSYNVYMDGILLGNVSQPLINNPSYNVSSLQPGTTYTITVTAVNALGESQPSQPISVTTIVPVPVLQVSVDGQNINLTWFIGIGNNYSILVNGKQVTQVTASPYTLTEKPGTYQIQIVQNYNGQQYPSNIVTATISAIQNVGSSQMTTDLVKNTGLVLAPIGGLLALALGLKGSPMLIAAIKTGMLSKWFR